MLIDTHCHLNMLSPTKDIPAVLDRATARGVGRIIIPAYDMESWSPILALVNSQHPNHPKLFSALGLHPWVADEISDLSALRDSLATALAGSSAVVAMGEIGLDAKVGTASKGSAQAMARQMGVLSTQLELAVELDLPVILHCRGAFEELLRSLQPFSGKIKGVLHAYCRGTSLAQRFIDAGLHIAFGGAVTRDRALKARQAAVALPLDKLVLETDAPSIGLDGVLPQDTEPCHVWNIARALAELRGETTDTIAEVTTRNAQQLFGI